MKLTGSLFFLFCLLVSQSFTGSTSSILHLDKRKNETRYQLEECKNPYRRKNLKLKVSKVGQDNCDRFSIFYSDKNDYKSRQKTLDLKIKEDKIVNCPNSLINALLESNTIL